MVHKFSFPVLVCYHHVAYMLQHNCFIHNIVLIKILFTLTVFLLYFHITTIYSETTNISTVIFYCTTVTTTIAISSPLCHPCQEVENNLVDSYLRALAQELEEPSHMQTLNHSHNYSLNTSLLPTTCLTRTSIQAVLTAVRRESAAAERERMGDQAYFLLFLISSSFIYWLVDQSINVYILVYNLLFFCSL